MKATINMSQELYNTRNELESLAMEVLMEKDDIEGSLSMLDNFDKRLKELAEKSKQLRHNLKWKKIVELLK